MSWVIDRGLGDEIIHVNHWDKVGYVLHPNIYEMKYCHEWLKLEWEFHLTIN